MCLARDPHQSSEEGTEVQPLTAVCDGAALVLVAMSSIYMYSISPSHEWSWGSDPHWLHIHGLLSKWGHVYWEGVLYMSEVSIDLHVPDASVSFWHVWMVCVLAYLFFNFIRKLWWWGSTVMDHKAEFTHCSFFLYGIFYSFRIKSQQTWNSLHTLKYIYCCVLYKPHLHILLRTLNCKSTNLQCLNIADDLFLLPETAYNYC